MKMRYNNKQREEDQKKRVKFDVMLNGRFIKTLCIEVEGSFVSEEKLRAYAESKLPLTLRGEKYEIYVDEFY